MMTEKLLPEKLPQDIRLGLGFRVRVRARVRVKKFKTKILTELMSCSIGFNCQGCNLPIVPFLLIGVFLLLIFIKMVPIVSRTS